MPFMIAHKKGHIINIGATAAKDMYQYGNVYCATKAAVDAISRTMRIDLLPHQIKVTAIHPVLQKHHFLLYDLKAMKQKPNKFMLAFNPC